MLMTAKNNMRRHVAVVNAFPEREKHEAALILTKTITEHKENKLDSKFSPFLYSYGSSEIQVYLRFYT